MEDESPYQPPASVGDLVWFDNDHDGLQDTSEPGIPGVTVHLLDGNGTPVLDPVTASPITAVTNANGEYTFDSLTPNTAYQVRFDPSTADTGGLPGAPAPPSLLPTATAAGSDPTVDSDIDPTTAIADAPTGPPGSATPTYDAGFHAG